MSIVLNHLIVPAADKTAAATFFADLLGLPVSAPSGPFVPVRVNDDLALDFDDRHQAQPGHYAFLIDDDTFDACWAGSGSPSRSRTAPGRAMAGTGRSTTSVAVVASTYAIPTATATSCSRPSPSG